MGNTKPAQNTLIFIAKFLVLRELAALSGFFVVCLVCTISLTTTAHSLEIQPFRITNLSPLTHASGIPSETTSDLLKSGGWQIDVTQDLASNYTRSSTANEQLLLDSELYRWNIALRHSISDEFELGLELPFVMHSTGFLDSFIEDWHRFWGLPQGGRDTATHNRLRYSYIKNGVTQFDIKDSSSGIGDMSLLGAFRLHESKEPGHHETVALRGQIQLPTGDSSRLLGSGSTDLSVLLTGAVNHNTGYGYAAVFGSIGGILRSKGSVLPEQQNNLVGLAVAGAGLSPLDWISLTVQLNLTTALYKNSSLTEVSSPTTMLTIGGTLKLPHNYLLDIAVSEDIAVATAPDVMFHIRLGKTF